MSCWPLKAQPLSSRWFTAELQFPEAGQGSQGYKEWVVVFGARCFGAAFRIFFVFVTKNNLLEWQLPQRVL